MNKTRLIAPIFRRRRAAMERWLYTPAEAQRRELQWLLKHGRATLYGVEHGFEGIDCYERYRERVPIAPYEDLRHYTMEMIGGRRDVLWPGVCRRFAQSSGTSDGKSKYIPVTDASLRRNHYHGSFDVVALYLGLYPDSRIFDGRAFILGGSFANELRLGSHPRAKVGDLSANLIDAMNPLANLVRVPSKRLALMADWHEKLPALAEVAARSDVSNISGVPSWFHAVLEKMLAITGATQVHDVWPRLEVFFHGGISMEPYRNLYNSIIDPQRMRYLETYNASEGFFAVQDSTDSRAMRLLLDAGCFFEFMPLGATDPREALAAWEVKEGKIYSLVITSCNGLWRYPLGDTVKIESATPLRITIAGRTKHFINAFGEEVMVYNTDAALTHACEATGARVLNYTVAPVYTTTASHGRHQWLIEFAKAPADMEAFAGILDHALQDENSDYQAKRTGNLFLEPLQIVVAEPGLFDRWLASTGKLGGQRKVPRLSNDRAIMDAMLKLN